MRNLNKNKSDKQALHTAGPWYVSSKSLICMPGNGDAVAEVFFETVPKSEAEANAHLLAAAPEMLEAIEQDHADADCAGEGFDDKNPCWHLVIIAKATGKG